MAEDIERRSIFTDLFTAGLVTAPAGIGLAAGLSQLAANKPAMPVPSKGTQSARGGLAQLGAQLGTRLREGHRAAAAEQEQRVKDAVDDLMQSDFVAQMSNKADEQRAVLQALSSTFDDPNIGLDPAVQQQYRQQLMQISDQMTPDQLRETIENLVNTVVQSDNFEAKAAFAKYNREFRNVGTHLSLSRPETGDLFNRYAPKRLSSQAMKALDNIQQGRIGRIEAAVANQGGTVNVVSKGGINYAQVYGSNRRYLTSIPLNPVEMRNARNPQAPVRVRFGEGLGTTYLAPEFFARASDLDAIAGRGGDLSFSGLRANGQLIDVSEWMIGRLESSLKSTPLNRLVRGKSKYNAALTEVMMPDERIMQMQDSALKSVIDRGLGAKMAQVRIYGMEDIKKDRRMDIVMRMSTQRGFDAEVGSDAYLSDVDGRTYSTLNIASRAPISGVKTGRGVLKDDHTVSMVAANRQSLPITARIRQVAHRTTAFVDPVRSLGRSGKMFSGASSQAGLIGLRSNQFAGHTNRAFLLDVGDGTNTFSQGLSGHINVQMDPTGGMGFSYGGFETIAGKTMPLLDPKHHSPVSTKMLNRVMNAGVGNFVEFTRDEAIEFGRVFGMGTAGMRSLPLEPSIKSYRIGLAEVSDSHGKKQLHIAMELAREAKDGVKLFSMPFKGTIFGLGANEFESVLQKFGLHSGLFEQMHIDKRDLIVAEGGMLKKSAEFMNQQILTAVDMVTGASSGHTGDIFDMSAEWTATRQAMAGLPEGKHGTGAIVSFAIEQLTKKNSSATEIGLVLGGVYAHGKNYGVTQKALESAVEASFKNRGEQEYAEILRQVKAGRALMAGSAAQGGGAETYVSARGSVERRSFEMLSQQMRTMGMTEEAMLDVFTDMYSRKVGMADHLKLTEEMTRLATALSGPQDLATLVDEGKLERVSLSKLVNEIGAESGGIEGYLRSKEKGVLLDVTSPTTKQERMLQSALMDQFGRASLYLPGKEAFAASPNVTIKTADGGQKSSDQFGKMMKGWIDNIERMAGDRRLVEDDYTRLLGEMQEEGVGLFSRLQHKLLSGKVQGSGTHLGSAYMVETGVGLSDYQHGLLKSIYDGPKNGGMNQFMNSQAFLSQMKDYASGAEPGDAAWKLKTFFTSLEQDPNRPGGRVGIAAQVTRHPILAHGNTYFANLYRDVREVNRGSQDEVWKMWTQSDAGRRALKKLRGQTGAAGQKINSFRQVSKFMNSHKSEVNAFFDSMQRNLKNWFTSEGGGVVFHGVRTMNVHYGDKKLWTDFGTLAMGTGDVDGDAYHVVLFGKKAGQRIMEGMKVTQKREYYKAQHRYQATVQIFAEEAKAGLKKLKNDMGIGEMDEDFIIRQDVQKEHASKAKVGLVDNQLSKLKRNLLEMSGASTDEITEAIAALQVVQEHSVIKGKKLPLYRPFADQLLTSIEALYRGESAAMQNFLQQNIFVTGTTDLWDGVKLSMEGGSAIANDVSNADLNLSRAMRTIQEAARQGMARPSTQNSSAGMLAYMLKNDDLGARAKALIDNVLAGDDALAAVLTSGEVGATARAQQAAMGLALDQTYKTGKSALLKAGPAMALGLAGTLVLGAGVAGTRSYMDQPDVTSLRVREAKAAASMFTPRQLPDDSRHMAPGPSAPGKNVSNAPHHVPRVHMRGGERVSGTVGSTQELDAVMQHVGSTPGMAGSARVYDDRQPMTNNAVERMFGLD